MSISTQSFIARLGLSVPIVQAPMAGYQASPLAIAAARAGALGSLPGASLSPHALRDEVAKTVMRADDDAVHYHRRHPK